MIIHVVGTPAPQGSKRAVIRGARAFVVDDNERTLPWREAVKYAAMTARAVIGCEPRPMEGPVYFSAIFTFTRPKSHYRTGRNAHLLRDDAPRLKTSKPDMDKLLRSTWDALTDAGVWRDDSQVAQLGPVQKVYGTTAGAHLIIEVGA